MADKLNFKQELTSLFGKPVSENPTQLMIEAAYAHHNLDWRYLTIEVDSQDLGDAVRGMRAMNFRGGNCTIPHKVDVIQYLDRLGESAALMGAVNCIVREGDELVGQNTDGKGFLSSLREVLNPGGKNIVIFGAGGAARAIGVELALAGVTRITVVNRSRERGEDLVDLLNKKTGTAADYVKWNGDYDIPMGTDVVINATSIGLYPDIGAVLPLNMDSLTEAMVVADVIPNPPETQLLRYAKKRGCRVIDGLGMLVAQGVIGFEYWTGFKPDTDVMKKVLKEVFESI
ncbi:MULTISPECIES: shikimate dehydrogenase [unclassified Oceanispirochaeta]|uniref:shikimate dehydrogenase n=1 Tax=unclassified Oceanispirochaeta TaxID=2635722 RepID=UPI000E090A36|nr:MULTISPECIES: shikimate dehydrogenase [unclassified Oceanispirochaeta]MBF9018021.1 shikimate dehydrogenase [Oceanispirochaeta sp. M2]NPD74533.1 shikimate dehydrogenase [Oceanispirochaeta sp. M1]RDG29645.1 shikimate dehydrogenase [Oceanispirochaeta sp. M1]